MAGGRDVCHIFRIRVCLAVKFDSRRISGYAFFRAGGRGLFCRCYSYFRSFLMVFILFTGKCHGAGLSILCPAPNRFAIAVAGCWKISDLFGIRIGLTVEFNSCRINGDTIFRASWFFFYSGSDACFFAFLMVLIIVADKGCRCTLAVLGPFPGWFSISVLSSRNHGIFFSG